MQSGEMMAALGELRGTVMTLERTTAREFAALRRELMEHVRLLHRLVKNGGSTHKRGIPWVNVLAMGSTGIMSLLGLLKPETMAAIWRALNH